MNRRIRLLALFILVPALWCVSCSRQPAQDEASAGLQAASAPRPTIVFMTDFGTANDAVAICKAVIYSVAPDVRLTDITHQVTPFSIEEGSRFLAGVTPYYPPGTVFLAVVDPGVGTSRKAVIVKSKKGQRSEEHTSELQSRQYLVCRLLLEKKKKYIHQIINRHVLYLREILY